MGTYCDRCHLLCGSINDINQLKPFDGWDCCSECRNSLHNLIQDDIDKHKKYNNIGGKE